MLRVEVSRADTPFDFWMACLVSEDDGTVVAHVVSAAFPDASAIVAMMSEADATAIGQPRGPKLPHLVMDRGAEMIDLGNELAARGYTILFRSNGAKTH